MKEVLKGSSSLQRILAGIKTVSDPVSSQLYFCWGRLFLIIFILNIYVQYLRAGENAGHKYQKNSMFQKYLKHY